MSLETMTKLATTTVGGGGTASITFSNIPQGYTDLKLVILGRDDRSGQPNGDFTMQVGFNGTINTGSVYTMIRIGSNGASAFSDSSAVNSMPLGMLSSATATSNVFGSNEVYITNYSGNAFKTVTCEGASETNATTAFTALNSGLISSSLPITDIKIVSYFGTTLSANSTLTLYGIKNLKKATGNSIKATGGNTTLFDGTYVYHVFTSTGTFQPTTPLTADILQIAGGGGGGTNASGRGGGGGGAGGLLSLSNTFFSSGVTYTCTVGAGGAAATNGNNSQIGPLTASVGGGKGGNGAVAGSDGGSGGGGGGNASYGSATSGQGNIGGVGTGNQGGGGGGAGAAGGAGTADSGPSGAGGNGSSAYSLWGLTTGTGQNVSGTYYFAGGGSGGGNTSTTTAIGSAGLGGGGFGSYNNTVPTAATANTGGGGGGGGYYISSYSGGAGGSGIVIVRYKG